jgi:hypothetical protein
MFSVADMEYHLSPIKNYDEHNKQEFKQQPQPANTSDTHILPNDQPWGQTCHDFPRVERPAPDFWMIP